MRRKRSNWKKRMPCDPWGEQKASSCSSWVQCWLLSKLNINYRWNDPCGLLFFSVSGEVVVNIAFSVRRKCIIVKKTEHGVMRLLMLTSTLMLTSMSTSTSTKTSMLTLTSRWCRRGRWRRVDVNVDVYVDVDVDIGGNVTLTASLSIRLNKCALKRP